MPGKSALQPGMLNLQPTLRWKVASFLFFSHDSSIKYSSPHGKCDPLDSELPVSIVKPLRDRTALEKHRVILECTVSSPRSAVTWYKGREELVASDRVEILADGCSHKLIIQQVAVEDEGSYSVEVGEHTSKARLMVEGKCKKCYF